MIHICNYYLFDDVPLELIDIRDDDIDPLFWSIAPYWENFTEYKCKTAIDLTEETVGYKDMHIIVCRWNTGKWSVDYTRFNFKVIN